MAARLFPSEEELDGILTGPDSVSWRVGSDARLYAVMLYPLLLQVAHPTVGAGVSDFSDFEHRPWDRLLRTIDYLTVLVYGGSEAVPAGRRLRALHQRFRGVRGDGRPYSALEPGAYAWVHATLIDTYVRGHACLGQRMSATEVERFYSEYRGLGRLIGVGENDLPADWAGFRNYFDDMTAHALERTSAVDRVLAAIRRVPPPPIPVPGMLWRGARVPAVRVLWLGSIGLMSQPVRELLGIEWSRRDQAAFRALSRTFRSLTPVLPRGVRITGPAQLRWRREAIAQGPLGS